MINNIMDVVAWKYKGFMWQCGETYDSFEWRDLNNPKPTLQEIESADVEYSKYLSDTKYINLRKQEYPKISDQLDMIWNSMDIGEIPKSVAFYNAIKLIKDKYPPPQGG